MFDLAAGLLFLLMIAIFAEILSVMSSMEMLQLSEATMMVNSDEYQEKQSILNYHFFVLCFLYVVCIWGGISMFNSWFTGKVEEKSKAKLALLFAFYSYIVK